MSIKLMGIFALLTSLIVFSIGTVGCSSRPASAQKLFEKGEYQRIIDKYPDLEIARRARAKIAEGLLAEKKFDQVRREYSDTPAAYQATEGLAQQLFAAGRYQAIVDSFSSSSVAVAAKEKLSDSLFAAGQLDYLLQRFPDTPKGMAVKEQRAGEALAKAKRLKGDAKKMALSDITRTYAGTESQKEATKLLSEIQQAELKKKNKK